MERLEEEREVEGISREAVCGEWGGLPHVLCEGSYCVFGADGGAVFEEKDKACACGFELAVEVVVCVHELA